MKYLGVPIKVGYITRNDWQHLIRKVERRLYAQKGRRGCSRLFINLVLTDILSYIMSYYYMLAQLLIKLIGIVPFLTDIERCVNL